MSQENVEIARRVVAAFDRRDRAAWLALQDEDLEVIPIGDWPEQGISGREAAWDFYTRTLDTFEDSPLTVVNVIDAGADSVLQHHRRRLRGRASGADVVFDYWVVATIRGRKIIRNEWFADRAKALEAVGLSE